MVYPPDGDEEGERSVRLGPPVKRKEDSGPSMPDRTFHLFFTPWRLSFLPLFFSFFRKEKKGRKEKETASCDYERKNVDQLLIENENNRFSIIMLDPTFLLSRARRTRKRQRTYRQVNSNQNVGPGDGSVCLFPYLLSPLPLGS